MKNNFLSIVAATLTAILMLSNANAQIAMNRKAAAGAGFTFADNSTAKTVAINKVNARAQKDFNSRFNSTTATSWYETENGFLAKFASTEEQTSVAYQKNGKWVYTISQYGEKSMPSQVRAIVKSTYYDYTIMGVQEIKVPDNENKIFLIHLQDATNIKTVRVCNDEMSVINDYKRG